MANPTARLVEMLEFRRPAFTVFEEAFIDKYIRPYKPHEDVFGNLIIDVGASPNILWSSHTDTVHYKSGLQQVMINKRNEVRVVPHKDSNCLGADCTTGVWLMLEMLDANIEGRYIFHRDEESGGNGSKWIAMKNPDLLKGISAAIAFDRKGESDVITFQGARTCSNEFAESLCAILGGKYKPSPHGMFTDTKSYRALVPECTNISVGYGGAHSQGEFQDLTHARWLRDQMIKFDSSSLVIKRTPTHVDEYQSYSHMPWRGHTGGTSGYSGYQSKKEPDDMFSLVQTYPTSTAKILESIGIDFDTMKDLIEMAQKPKGFTNLQMAAWNAVSNPTVTPTVEPDQIDSTLPLLAPPKKQSNG